MTCDRCGSPIAGEDAFRVTYGRGVRRRSRWCCSLACAFEVAYTVRMPNLEIVARREAELITGGEKLARRLSV
jgi:hypothetical protein